MIELLMVIAIILTLAALLLPAGMRAQAATRRVACTNNLKQIGMASFGYSEEYDQYVMPGKFGDTSIDGNYNHWINYMFAELIPDKKVFRCPALGDSDNFNPAGGDNSIRDASYIRNMIEPDNWGGAAISSDPSRSLGWGTPTKHVRLQQILDPSSKINIMDVASGGIHFNHSGVLKFQETDYGAINAVPTVGFRRVGYHHQLGFNALMGDYHTEFIKQSEPDQWVVVIE